MAGWADGGHNAARGVTPTSTPTTTSQGPTSLAAMPAPESSKAPARISNRTDGRIYSLTELAYIYDPFQQDPFIKTPASTADVDNTWKNAWKNGFNASSTIKSKYGSHSTLRIGRPEFKDFAADGTRAANLMDIFSVGDPAGDPLSKQVNTRGKININTANREALRALGAGIKIGNLNAGDVDQAIQPSGGVFGPQNSSAADVFADAVISARQTRPFVSTSQLAWITGSSGEPFFGNPSQWPSSGPTEWNDAAAEQYFAKIYNFTTTRSRNFRTFVTGQYVDPTQSDPMTGKSPRVIATANKVYELFLKPNRDSSTGVINSQQIQVTYSADIQ